MADRVVELPGDIRAPPLRQDVEPVQPARLHAGDPHGDNGIHPVCQKVRGGLPHSGGQYLDDPEVRGDEREGRGHVPGA